MGWIRDWGSSPREREQSFPCDAHLGAPVLTLHRAVTVAAPPSIVFRWLCQLRAAPYSYDWIDNGGRRSPRVLTPGLDQLEVGQTVMSIFRLADYTAGEHLTLVTRGGGAERLFGKMACTYRVQAERDDGAASTSRLVVRLLAGRPAGLYRWLSPLFPLGDWVMMRKQLLNLKRLAERSARE